MQWNQEPLNQISLASRRGEPIPAGGTASIALDPTFGSFTLLEPASH